MTVELPIISHTGIDVSAVAGITWTPDPVHLAANHIVGLGHLDSDQHPFTMIRSALLDHARSTSTRIFAVTSAEPGNGKTHVAANLAMMLARVQPTMLVELDLRRPALGKRLGLPDDYPGVEDYLAGACPWTATQARAEGMNLSVHRVRGPRADVGQLLATNALRLALRSGNVAEGETICIVDTPPAILSDDLLLISRHVDGVLLVAEEGRTAAAALRETLRTISATPVIGTVLNRSISAPSPRIDYGYYGTVTSDA